MNKKLDDLNEYLIRNKITTIREFVYHDIKHFFYVISFPKIEDFFLSKKMISKKSRQVFPIQILEKVSNQEWAMILVKECGENLKRMNIFFKTTKFSWSFFIKNKHKINACVLRLISRKNKHIKLRDIKNFLKSNNIYYIHNLPFEFQVIIMRKNLKKTILKKLSKKREYLKIKEDLKRYKDAGYTTSSESIAEYLQNHNIQKISDVARLNKWLFGYLRNKENLKKQPLIITLIPKLDCNNKGYKKKHDLTLREIAEHFIAKLGGIKKISWNINLRSIDRYFAQHLSHRKLYQFVKFYIMTRLGIICPDYSRSIFLRWNENQWADFIKMMEISVTEVILFKQFLDFKPEYFKQKVFNLCGFNENGKYMKLLN